MLRDITVQVIWIDGDMSWKAEEGTRIVQLAPDGRFYLVKNAGEEVADQIIRCLRSCSIE